MNLFDELEWRGLVHQATEGAREHVSTGSRTIYVGFDPTADSLHVGSLLPLLALKRIADCGHRPLAVIGGATGMIGDPSGKSAERTLQTVEQVEHNARCLKEQIARICALPPERIVFENNADWLTKLTLIDLLRDVGKHFSLASMIAKDSVKRRLEGQSGISFTEFTYQVLQAYDFLVLHQKHGCTVQVGGSDQYGNITAGIDLVHARAQAQAFGITWPLVTSSSGVKFGKTEAGAVWLDAKRTSPYRFFQFWMNVEDEQVVKYLKLFTFLTQVEIAALEAEHAANPGARAAHKRLAEDVTRRVHGDEGLARAQRATEVFFGGSMDALDVTELLDVFGDVPSSTQARSKLDGEGMAMLDVLVDAQLATSRKDARRAIESGGVYVNNQRAESPDAKVTRDRALGGQVIVLRKGKRSYHVVRLDG